MEVANSNKVEMYQENKMSYIMRDAYKRVDIDL